MTKLKICSKKFLVNFLTWYKFKKTIEIIQVMKHFLTYLSTAPVIAFAWLSFTAGLIIEINRFFPDPLIFTY